MLETVLLTGSTGFLGQIIKNELAGYKIITVGRHNCNVMADLSTQIPVLPVCNLVIHAAGKAHSVPKTEDEKRAFYDVNVKGTEHLLAGLCNTGIPTHFVFISTVAVYGLSEGQDIDEKAFLGAKDAYGESKILAEERIQEWCDKNGSVCTILRLPLIAGKNPPGNLKSMIKAIKTGLYFNVEKGNARKSIVLGQDVANAIPKAALHGGIYNLTDSYHPSFYELSSLISAQLNKKTPRNLPMNLAVMLGRLGDIGRITLFNTDKLIKMTTDLTFQDVKAKEVFGWDPVRVLEGFRI